MKTNSKLSILFATFAAAGAANATQFHYDYTTTAGDSAALNLTANWVSSGVYQITDITGERDGQAVTSFQNGGPGISLSSDGLWLYNNLIYTHGATFDYYGIVFDTSAGEFNVYNNNPMVEYGSNNGQYTSSNQIVGSKLSSVPGLGAYVPFVVGLGAVFLRRRVA